MVKQLVVVWIVVAAGIAVSALVLPSVEVGGGALGLLGVSLLYGLVNASIGTLLRMVALPLTVLTYGVLSLVINGILLAITAGLSRNLEVGGFFACLLAAVVITLVTGALLYIVGRVFGRQGA